MKYALAALGILLLAVVLGIGFFRYGVDAPAATGSAMPAGTPVTFTELASGDQSSVMTRKNYLITSNDQLRDLWKLIDESAMPPVVDFSKYAVIAVFAGQEPTAGYAIAISSILDSSQRVVTVTVTTPGGSCVLAQHVTDPYQVIELPTTALPLTHQDAVATASCLQ